MPKIEAASEERKAEARLYYDRATAPDADRQTRKNAWGDLWMFQKTCKKGWVILGFNAREIERIKLNKPDWV